MLGYFLANVFVFLLGLIAGSFLNVVIYRLEKKEKLTGRSFCPHCRHTLNWRDLFPVASFILLLGRCRHCKKKISWQYPLVEISTAVIFLLIFNFQFSIFNGFSIFEFLNLLFYFYLASSLIAIFVYDLKYYLIPDKVLFPAIIITFAYRLFENFALFGGYLFAVAAAAGFFLAIFLVSGGQWLGFGDVKLAILMGLALGMPNIQVALFLSFFFGAIIGTMLMLLSALGRGGRKMGLKSQMPFGPFLVAGTFMAMFWGREIIEFYWKIFSI